LSAFDLDSALSGVFVPNFGDLAPESSGHLLSVSFEGRSHELSDRGRHSDLMLAICRKAPVETSCGGRFVTWPSNSILFKRMAD
jgi:hypothetical protein